MSPRVTSSRSFFDRVIGRTDDGNRPRKPARAPIEVPARISRLELSTGRREPWKELLPDDLAGVNVTNTVVLTRDGRSYAYTCGQILSDLYLVEGLK